MNAETILMGEPSSQENTSSTKTAKRGRNWRGWKKRGRGSYRGRGQLNYSEVNENKSESHPGKSWDSQQSNIATEEQVVESLDIKENNFRGRPWRQRRSGWQKWGSNERNEECQDLNSQKMKLPRRGRSRYNHNGNGKLQQCEDYDQSAEEMLNSDMGVTRDDIEIRSFETDSSYGEAGVNFSAGRSRGYKAGRGRGGYFRGSGKKKQHLNNENKQSISTKNSWVSQESNINTEEQIVDERNEECQDVSSEEMKLPRRGRSKYKHNGGRGRMQQCEDNVHNAEEMLNSNLNLTGDDIETRSIETDSSYGANAVRSRGYQPGRGRGNFRGRGRKKQYLNNEENNPEEDASSECTDLSASGWGYQPGRGRGNLRGRGRKKQYLNNEENNPEEDASSECTDLSASGWGYQPGRGRGNFRGRGRKKQYLNNEENNPEEDASSECTDLSASGWGNARNNFSERTDDDEDAHEHYNSTFGQFPGRGRGGNRGRGQMHQRGSYIQKNKCSNRDEKQYSDIDSQQNGDLRLNKNSIDLAFSEMDSSYVEEGVNTFRGRGNKAKRGYFQGRGRKKQYFKEDNNQEDVSFKELTYNESNSKILEEDNVYVEEQLATENVQDRSISTENNEHLMEKPNIKTKSRNRRRNRRKWIHYYDKERNNENIFAGGEELGLEKNTADDEHYCLDNNKTKETKTNVHQPDVLSADGNLIQDRISFEKWFSSNWLDISKGGMPTYPGQFVHPIKNQEPKQDLDTNKDNKISLQDLFSKAPPLVNKDNAQSKVPDTLDFDTNTASSQTMASSSKTVDVTISRNVDSVAATSVATAVPVTITATTIPTSTAGTIRNGTITRTLTSNIQTPSTVTAAASSSTKVKPGLITTNPTTSYSDPITALASTKISLANAQTTSYNTVQHPTSTSTPSAKINSSVPFLSVSTNSMKISPPSPPKQSLPKTVIASHVTATSSSTRIYPDISMTAKPPTSMKHPVISNSSSFDEVSATGFSNHTNLESHKTSSHAAVGTDSPPQKKSPDSFTHSFASTISARRKTVSQMTLKRTPGNSNKLEYQLTDECKLIIKSYGDIVKEKSELLVCVVGPDADMRKTKVGQSFLKEFPSHLQELQHNYKKNPYSPVITIHKPLGFKGKAICHIILTPWNKDKSQGQIDIALHELFTVVNELRIESISIPPLGVGLAFRFPPKYMVHWLLKHIKNMTIGRYLKKIVLLAPSSELFDELKHRASKYFVCANTYYIEEDMGGDSIQIEDGIFNIRPKQGTLDYMNYLAQQETVFPSYWELGKTNKKSTSTWWGFKSFVASYFTGANKPYLVDVSEETKATISKLVVESQDPHVIGHGADATGMNYSSIKVIDVQRIEQPALFEKYHHKRKEILKKWIRKGLVCQDVGKLTGSKGKVLTKTLLSDSMKNELYSEINEHYLFHGTKAKALENIVVNGFNTSCSNALSLFGQGIYMAEKSTKADQYTDEKSSRSPNGTKLSLILTRVLLGNVFVCDENHPRLKSKVCRKFTKPPCMLCREDLCLCGSGEHYDSVMGDGKWLFREFVVYEESQCYPEYLITYQRV